MFCSVSKGQQLPHTGGKHVLLGSREEEGFSGDGLELMAELTDSQENTGEHSWSPVGPRGVHCSQQLLLAGTNCNFSTSSLLEQ